MRNVAPRQHITQQQQGWRSHSHLLLLQVSRSLSQSLAVSIRHIPSFPAEQGMTSLSRGSTKRV